MRDEVSNDGSMVGRLLAAIDKTERIALGRCAADRKIVARHRPEDRSGWRGPGDYGPIDPACAECGSQDLAVSWPCATLTLLAEGCHVVIANGEG